MSTVTASYFHSASLRQRFLHELDRALGAGLLLPAEQAWLKKLTLAPSGDGVAVDPDPVRVDRLLLEDGSFSSLEFCAALLLSHGQTTDGRIYLFTLARGLEVFSDRPTLVLRGLTRFVGGDTLAALECEQVEGDAFVAQMRAIVEYQASTVRRLTSQFRLTPGLFTAVSVTLEQQVRRLLPHLHLDPAKQLMRFVRPASGAEAEFVLLTQTLAQTAFDDVCNAEGLADLVRQFLDGEGRVVSERDASLLAQALRDTITALPLLYEQLLGKFWQQPADGRLMKDIARESYTASLHHELYRRVQDGTVSEAHYLALSPSLQPAPNAADGNLRGKRIVLHWDDGTRKPLAGTFVLNAGAGDSVFWFSPEHDLRRFDSLGVLTTFCSSPDGRERLRASLALEDQTLLLRAGALQLSLEDIAEPLITERVDSILALQMRNLHYVCGLMKKSATAAEKVSAMFDDALDVRQLIDPRQQHFSVGRWSRDMPINFQRVWMASDADDLIQVGSRDDPAEAVLFPYDEASAGPPTAYPLAPSWLEQTQATDEGAEHLRELDNALVGYAEHVLQTYVCVASSTRLLARDVRVRWLESLDPSDVEVSSVVVSESLDAVSKDLVSLLLERVSGHRSGAVPHAAQILLPAENAGTALDIELVNLMIERTATGFIARYLEHFQQSRTGLARLDNRQFWPVALALALREDGLRLDLALRRRMLRVSDGAEELVQQVLNSPARGLRVGAGARMTEVFTLALVYGNAPHAQVSDALVLWQPLNAAAGVMLWVGSRGWRHFESVQTLDQHLLGGFRGAQSERWLNSLGEHDQSLLRTYLSASPAGAIRVQLDRVNGHAIEALQQTVFNRQLQNLKQLCARALRCRFEAQLFSGLARSTELDEQLVTMLDSLAVRIDVTLFEELLPQWLKSASVADLKTYNGIWRRYYLASSGKEDFLFGIPTLGDYSRNRLIEQFAKDFPEKQWDPDQITITLRRYVPALPGLGQIPSGIPAATVVSSESLTDYAVNRFVDIQDGTLTVESAKHPDAVEFLTANYLRTMIRLLDVGAGFMVLLRRALNPADPDWSRRSQLYVDQLPPMMQAVAMQQKLEDTLSAKAYTFISRIVEMPDGIARMPVGETHVIISPLQLLADEGMTPDAAKGVYLICPRDTREGPVVLHAIAHPDFVFREYLDQAALLADIRSEDSLQRMLLERIDPEVRKRYEHGGFTEPHLPFSTESFGDVPTHTPGPVCVSLAEKKGNALHFLFTDTLNLLVDMGVANTVTTVQADQASRKFLGMLGLEQVVSILPGKLSTMVALWQSHTLFRASAESASARRWGEAISEFIAALGAMEAAREQADKDELITGELATGQELMPTTFEWAGLRLTADQLKRLHALEAKKVSLSDLKRDELLSLYLDSKTQTPYAAVGGKVYRVRRRDEDGRWMIIGEDATPGPLLKLDAHQRWQLDLHIGLKGGGGVLTKIRASGAEVSAEDAIVIEASGMPEIRKLYRHRALHIAEAHLQAKHYLENCLDNLNVHTRGAPLDPRVQEIIGDFFGVNPPSQELLIETERVVKALFDEVMDASMSSYSSPRFVIGSSRPGHEDTLAFIIKTDPKKRLFLTERFFQVPPYNLPTETRGFDLPAHYRAATLIHELSHLVLNTHDIAYLETSAPYPDLLRGDSANNIKLRTDLERLQSEGLSHESHRDDLFMHMCDGEWTDLDPEDSDAYDAVLKLTRTRTLEEARDVFLNDGQKRSQVLMNNADSVTLLILRLGRRNFVVPTPLT